MNLRRLTAICVSSVLLVSMLAGCSKNNDQVSASQTPQESQSASSETSSQPISESSAEEQDELSEESEPQPDVAMPAPADAALYRGVVGDITPGDEDSLTIEIAQPVGVNYSMPKLTVVVNKNTSAGFDTAGIKQGDYVEVYYGPAGEQAPESVDAIVINRLAPAEVSVFNGTVKEITPDENDENSGDILLESLDDQSETIFHYSDETQFYLDFATLEVGTKLNIHHSGATTRSIPPQGNALEVRSYFE